MVKSYVEVIVVMPPICEICSREFDPDKEGGLIYFKETEKGRAFEEKAKEEKWTGHPPDAAWFCGEHYEESEKLVHLTLDDATKSLKKIYGE